MFPATPPPKGGSSSGGEIVVDTAFGVVTVEMIDREGERMKAGLTPAGARVLARGLEQYAAAAEAALAAHVSRN